MKVSRTAKIVSCVVAGGLVATVSAAFLLTKSKPQEVKQIAIKYGIPTDQKELYASSSVPDQSNAYPEVMEIAGFFDKQTQAQKKQMDQIEKMLGNADASPSDAADLLALTDQYEPMIRRVVAKGQFQYKKDFSDPANVLFPELAVLKRMTKIKTQRAKAYAITKQYEKAVSEMKDAVTITNLLHQEHFLLSPLVLIALQQIARTNLMQLAMISQDATTIEACKKLDDSFLAPNIKNALRGEAYMQVTTLLSPVKSLESIGVTGSQTAELQFLQRTQGLWERKYISKIGEWYKQITDAKSLSDVRTANAALEAWAGGNEPECKFARYMAPVYSQFCDAVEKLEVSAAIADVGFDFAKTNKLPDPITITDPYTGDHPVLKQTKVGWALLFAGRDGVISDDVKETDGALQVRGDHALVFDRIGLRLTGN